MSSNVKKLEVTYNPINASNTFTNGDVVTGQVTLEVAKDCQIESLWIKFKGKSEVLWTERHGQVTMVYHSKDKYFSIKHHFIGDGNLKDNEEKLQLNQNLSTYSSAVGPGCHVYPFTFQVPVQEMPSSFKGSVGKIVYLLEAKLSRSMRIPKKDSTKIRYVTKGDFNSIPGLLEPQHESKDKKMKFFNSGTVAMDVKIEKSGFRQGEGMTVVAHIENNSSREIKPKYCVYRKHSFFALGKRRLDTKDLLKEVGEPIPPSTSTNVTRVITIPSDLEPSIVNCSNIKAEYRLRVYLDVKYASDPEIKLPIVVMPASEVPEDAVPPAATGFGFEPFGTPNPPSFWTPNPPPFGTPNAPPFGAPNPPPFGIPNPPPFGAPNPPPFGAPNAPPFGAPNPPPFGTPNPPPFGAPNPPPFGTPNPPPFGVVPPQRPAAAAVSQFSDPPPPYTAYGMYPLMNDFTNT